MDLDYISPGLSDLRARARSRVPRYMWEYLDSGTGSEASCRRAEAALDGVVLLPAILGGEATPDLRTRLLGQDYAYPFGIAPVGMSGAFWPRAEALLARTAVAQNIPYCMSTVAATTPEDIAPHLGTRGWFQLYPPNSAEIRRDMLARARAAGFHTLVLTVDVPVLSWREREKRVRLKNPMTLTPSVILQSARHPVWALSMLAGPPLRPRIFDKYAATVTKRPGDKHLGLTLRTIPDWEYLAELRREWDGPLIVKGVLDPADAPRLIEAGTDAIWVSNHGGRQFEAAPAPLTQLPQIRAVVGPDYPLIYDGAVRSGTDVLRAIAMGADFVMLGRAFHHGLAAHGAAGAAHVVRILSQHLISDMAQIAVTRPVEARARVI